MLDQDLGLQGWWNQNLRHFVRSARRAGASADLRSSLNHLNFVLRRYSSADPRTRTSPSETSSQYRFFIRPFLSRWYRPHSRESSSLPTLSPALSSSTPTFPSTSPLSTSTAPTLPFTTSTHKSNQLLTAVLYSTHLFSISHTDYISLVSHPSHLSTLPCHSTHTNYQSQPSQAVHVPMPSSRDKHCLSAAAHRCTSVIRPRPSQQRLALSLTPNAPRRYHTHECRRP